MTIRNKIFNSQPSLKLALASAFLSLIIAAVTTVLLTQPSPNISSPTDLTLSVQRPVDTELVTESTLIVKGQTKPQTSVIVYTDKHINSVESNLFGEFESPIPLVNGINQLQVLAFSASGEQKQIDLDVIYDNDGQIKGESTSAEEKKDKTPPGQEKKQETPAADSGQAQQSAPQSQPAAQGSSQSQSPPIQDQVSTAIVGSVEQVKTDAVVVGDKTEKNSVEVKVSQTTQIINQNNRSVDLQTVKPNDKAAIIPKLGTTKYETTTSQTTSTLTETKSTILTTEAAKIYVNQADSMAQVQRQGLQGFITQIDNDQITIQHQVQKERLYTFYINSQTEIKIRNEFVAISDLAVGQLIALVGEYNQAGDLIARLIHIINQTASDTAPQPSITSEPDLVTPSSITPQISEALTPTSTELPSVTPLPIAISCSLTSAQWVTTGNPVTEEEVVTLEVETSGDCTAQQIAFEVMENDSLFEGGVDDPVVSQPATIILSTESQIGQSTWTAEWQADCNGFCNPPEYYFTATLENGNALRSADPLLQVVRLPTSPTASLTPTLSPTSTPSPFRIVSPNGGEQLPFGSPYTIRWTGGDPSPDWPIFLSIIDASRSSTLRELTVSTVNDQTEDWIVDLPLGDYIMYAQGCRFCDTGSQWDYSDAPFSVVAGTEINPVDNTNPPNQSLVVLSPGGGEVWTAGTTENLKWSGGTDEWTLDISLIDHDNNVVHSTLYQNTVNDGSQSWAIPPSIQPGLYKISVSCTNCGSGVSGYTNGFYAYSFAPFTIQTASTTLTPTPSPTLTPTPALLSCELHNAYWYPLSNLDNGQLLEGQITQLKVEGRGNCAGKQVDFRIVENDSLIEGGIDDPILRAPSPASLVFSSYSNIGSISWRSEWQSDCNGLCEPPEYFFTATVQGGNTIKSGLLAIRKFPVEEYYAQYGSLMTPTPTLSPVTPTPPPCQLSRAFWYLPNVIVNEGSSVLFEVHGTGDCAGKTVSVQVFEQDSAEGGVDVPANVQPTSANFSTDSQYIQGRWLAEGQNDCNGACNPPE